MEEERPLREAREAMNDGLADNGNGNGSNGSGSSNNNLIIGGIVLVVILLIAGVFLPPISLGERLGLGGEEDPAATEEPQEVPTETVSEIPGQFSTTAQGVAVATATAADLGAAVDGLPAGFNPQEPFYTVTFEGSPPTGATTIALPSEAQPLTAVDLYGWDGEAWRFIPTQIENNQLVTGDEPLPQAFAVTVAGSVEQKRIGAELLPAAEMPPEVVGALGEINLGTLTLMNGGGVAGESTAAPEGSSAAQFLLATNTGVFVDTASLQELLANGDLQAQHVSELVARVTDGNHAGLTLDYRGAAAAQSEAFTSFVAQLEAALHGADKQLAITLAPEWTDQGWVRGGYDWATLARLADVIYLQMPLDPAAYGDQGPADQLVQEAIRDIERRKLSLQVSANAVDGVEGTFVEIPNVDALANFGELVFTEGGEEIEPGAAVEVALSGSASPLEWDLESVAYQYGYEEAEQAHTVWLGNAAALNHRMRFANTYHLRGVNVRGLSGTVDGAPYVQAINSFLGIADPPQPDSAGIAWTVSDAEGGVVASTTAEVLTFRWESTETPGVYTVSAEFAQGGTVAGLGEITVSVTEPEVVEAEPETPEAPEEEPEDTTDNGGGAVNFGDGDGVVNTGANVRTGPSVAYPTLAGGANAGTVVDIIGRNSASTWYNVILPDDREGWIFGNLVDLRPGFDVAALDVIDVDPPTVAGGGGGSGEGSGSSGGGTTPPPPPPPVAGGNLELGGHAFGAPYALMSSAGMNWVKRQIKWSPGMSPDAAAGPINEARNAGFKVLLSIPGQLYPSSIDFAGYTDFLRGVAALGPDAIEVWNEQNLDREWPAGQIDPGQYVSQMLAPAYQAIKAVSPGTLVIAGALAPTGFDNGTNAWADDRYLAGMAAAGAASYMDCIGAHHNAGATSPGATSGHPTGSGHYSWYFLPTMNLYYNSFGGARQVCFTETGYVTTEGTGQSLPSNFAWGSNITLANQAQWLAEAVSLAANSGRVRLFIVWNVDSTFWSGTDPQGGYAILRPNGSCPACAALAGVMGGG